MIKTVGEVSKFLHFYNLYHLFPRNLISSKMFKLDISFNKCCPEDQWKNPIKSNYVTNYTFWRMNCQKITKGGFSCDDGHRISKWICWNSINLCIQMNILKGVEEQKLVTFSKKNRLDLFDCHFESKYHIIGSTSYLFVSKNMTNFFDPQTGGSITFQKIYCRYSST